MTDVQKELIKTADLIRKKYRALKRGRDMIDETRIENLKPITEPLKELIEVQKTEPLLALPPPPPTHLTPKLLPRLTEASLTPTRIITNGNIARSYLSQCLKEVNDSE